ncbi:MAG: alpha-galactosidase [Lachnospiraceae bacterium]|nr:alpha-galactosidase [Lachnospiraceae bacterium]
MVEVKENENGKPLFVLTGKNTTYACKVMENGQIEHLYYGPKIAVISSDGLSEHFEFAPPNSCAYSSEFGSFSAEDVRYEYSAPGKGDIREPMIEAVYADGSRTLDPVYVSHEVKKGKPGLNGLPSSYGKDEEVETLGILLKDRNGGLEVLLIYSLFAEADVLTRCVHIQNAGDKPVTLTRALSMQLDLDPDAYTFHAFTGAWAREMKKTDIPLKAGRVGISSRTGCSSNRANPFFMISRSGTNEDAGLCYGFNLVYSGDHYESAERSAYGKVRVLSGIQPEGFSWQLLPGESFQTPEAILSVSEEGFGGLSRRFHHFIRSHVVRGEWQYRERPVLLNSWEAAYFDISESRLYRLVRVAKSVGIELFVMDDGWFGKRDDDTSSLGDWTPNKKKLPRGVKGLADKIVGLGMKFGIWVEPEMVNENSELYRSHPDWVLRIPGKDHSTGRNQMVLDLSRSEVRENIIAQMRELFSSAEISYVKWDMNRIMTDLYSQALPPERQGEVRHRYILGLYHIMEELTKAFPHILFEGCASGGNRFDPGILSYFPQIWASDDTDAVARAQIQNGYSYGYPQSCYTSHVSDVPNHQTLRRTPLETRFNIACLGVLGYECNLADLSNEELESVREQIALYKEWRKLLQYGDLYRGRCFAEAGEKDVLDSDGRADAEWTVVSPDGMRAVSVILQLMVRPNTHLCILKPKGLKALLPYRCHSRVFKTNLKDYGGLVNYVAPIHVKQDGTVHNILSKFVKLETEKEEHLIMGSALMRAGLRLSPAFAGGGYNDKLRYFPDFASRMYFFEGQGEPVPALPMKEGEGEEEEHK